MNGFRCLFTAVFLFFGSFTQVLCLEEIENVNTSLLRKDLVAIYGDQDPVFQFYSSALKEFISRSPKWVNTINATEGGSIFGDRITCTTFHEFLEKYHA